MYKFIMDKLKKKPESLDLQYMRPDFVASIPKNGKILEIGPFFSPVCIGKNVKYFDILSQSQLKKRAIEHGHTDLKDNIPFIDYVSPSGNLSIVKEKFDIVLSSHVIEHQLDLVKHLSDVGNILKSGGKYFILIPDKRYCFDHFLPESGVAEVLTRHIEKPKTHSLKSVIEHRALTTHNDPGRHWEGDHGSPDDSKRRLNAAISEHKKTGGKNLDVHVWYFTPDSFRSIITSLQDLGLTNLRIRKIYPTATNTLEFFAILEKPKSK